MMGWACGYRVPSATSLLPHFEGSAAASPELHSSPSLYWRGGHPGVRVRLATQLGVLKPAGVVEKAHLQGWEQ